MDFGEVLNKKLNFKLYIKFSIVKHLKSDKKYYLIYI